MSGGLAASNGGVGRRFLRQRVQLDTLRCNFLRLDLVADGFMWAKTHLAGLGLNSPGMIPCPLKDDGKIPHEEPHKIGPFRQRTRPSL
jgi:hypothetical protein